MNDVATAIWVLVAVVVAGILIYLQANDRLLRELREINKRIDCLADDLLNRGKDMGEDVY